MIKVSVQIGTKKKNTHPATRAGIFSELLHLWRTHCALRTIFFFFSASSEPTVSGMPEYFRIKYSLLFRVQLPKIFALSFLFWGRFRNVE